MLDLLALNSTQVIVQILRSTSERLVVTPLVSHLQAIGPDPQDGPVDEARWGFVLKVANPSDRSVVIKRIDVLWLGAHGLRAQNRPDLTQVSQGTELSHLPGELSLPLMVSPASEILVVVGTTMCMYRSRPLRTRPVLARYAADELHARLRRIRIDVGTSQGLIKLTIDTKQTALLYVGRTIRVLAHGPTPER